jgi:hypothetical protein
VCGRHFGCATHDISQPPHGTYGFEMVQAVRIIQPARCTHTLLQLWKVWMMLDDNLQTLSSLWSHTLHHWFRFSSFREDGPSTVLMCASSQGKDACCLVARTTQQLCFPDHIFRAAVTLTWFKYCDLILWGFDHGGGGWSMTDHPHIRPPARVCNGTSSLHGTHSA